MTLIVPGTQKNRRSEEYAYTGTLLITGVNFVLQFYALLFPAQDLTHTFEDIIKEVEDDLYVQG